MHTETGPGVYEAAIRYDDPLRAADKAALFKTAMKSLRARHGCSVTFMAKWNREPARLERPHPPVAVGEDREEPVRLIRARRLRGGADKKSDIGISQLGQRYLGGLDHARRRS